MTDLHWTTLRDRAIRGFNGELPNPTTEQDLIDAFEQNPAAVSRSLDEVTGQVAAGKVRSGWAVWRARTLAVHSSSEAIGTLDDGRDKRVRAAEAWIRNAGVHLDREAEVEDELFGDLGKLRDWAGDTPLRERLLRLWQEQRPRGEQAERDQLERAAKWKRDQERIAERTRAAAVVTVDEDIPLPAIGGGR